jgi:hypothetical protein
MVEGVYEMNSKTSDEEATIFRAKKGEKWDIPTLKMDDASLCGNLFVISIAVATGPVGRDELRNVGAGVAFVAVPLLVGTNTSTGGSGFEGARCCCLEGLAVESMARSLR